MVRKSWTTRTMFGINLETTCNMKNLLLFILLSTTTCSAQTVEQVRQELQRQGVPHHEIVLAQARHETGNFKSRLCRENKNLFGMKKGKRYARYAHWKESIRDYKERISSRYQGGNYYAFLQKIGYAQDPKYISKLKRF